MSVGVVTAIRAGETDDNRQNRSGSWLYAICYHSSFPVIRRPTPRELRWQRVLKSLTVCQQRMRLRSLTGIQDVVLHYSNLEEHHRRH